MYCSVSYEEISPQIPLTHAPGLLNAGTGVTFLDFEIFSCIMHASNAKINYWSDTSSKRRNIRCFTINRELVISHASSHGSATTIIPKQEQAAWAVVTQVHLWLNLFDISCRTPIVAVLGDGDLPESRSKCWRWQDHRAVSSRRTGRKTYSSQTILSDSRWVKQHLITS